jgi:signal transduction histidine kinase
MPNVRTSTSPSAANAVADGASTGDSARDAAGVVHDLGNLIQIASSALNIIARNPRIGDGALGPVVARARTSLERAGALVRQTVGRVGQGRAETPVLTEAVCVRACLDEIALLLAGLCEPTVNLVIEAAANLPPIRCNRLNLQNVILNLMLNARDAMPDGGTITITLNEVIPPGCGLELRVVDTGAGMSPETLERAFEPYFTTKEPARGGGLGLAMVKRFTQEVGGSVQIVSAPGAGAAVTMRLPRPADPTWPASFHPAPLIPWPPLL